MALATPAAMTAQFRTALITGASSGIGRALALSLARSGTHVFAAARRREELALLEDEARAQGGRITGVTLDVTETVQVVERVHALQREADGLDLVLANAGMTLMAPPHTLTWDHVQPVLLTNLMGACAVLTAAIADMVERRRGTLAAVSSLAGQFGLQRSSAYSASKAGLSTFLQGLRPGLRPSGIKVVDIRPGYVHTPMTANAKVSKPMAMEVDEAVERILKGLRRGRPVVAFPTPLAAATWVLRQLPPVLADAANSRMAAS
jgi:short-subunit dehydrogenase